MVLFLYVFQNVFLRLLPLNSIFELHDFDIYTFIYIGLFLNLLVMDHMDENTLLLFCVCPFWKMFPQNILCAMAFTYIGLYVWYSDIWD